MAENDQALPPDTEVLQVQIDRSVSLDSLAQFKDVGIERIESVDAIDGKALHEILIALKDCNVDALSVMLGYLLGSRALIGIKADGSDVRSGSLADIAKLIDAIRKLVDVIRGKR